MKFKNIIFDLGGVILNIDYSKTIKAFKALGIDDFDTLYTQASQSLLFDHIEKGEITPEIFLAELQQHLPPGTSMIEIENAWNAMLLNLPQKRLDLLEKLKRKYNTVLLSNTNAIHIASFLKRIQKENKIQSLDAYFDHVYFSCEMKLRKPDPEIFELVCKEQGYSPSETLFIDDSVQHIQGAQNIGLNAYWLNNKELVDLFDMQLNFTPSVLDITQ